MSSEASDKEPQAPVDKDLDEDLDEDEEEDDDDDNLVILIDDDDTEHRFVLILTVELDGKEYGVLAPEEGGEDPEDLELSIFEIEASDDGDNFIAIEDDETFEKVRAACAELLGIDDSDETGAGEETDEPSEEKGDEKRRPR